MRKQWHTDPIIFCVFASWALAFVFIKMALEPEGGFSPLAFLWPRLMLSAVILFALLLVIREPVRVPRKHIMKTVLIGVLGIGSYHLLFTIALSMTTALDTALIIGTGPVLTALWMPIFKMERARPRAWVGITICFVTVAVITLTGAADKATGTGWNTRCLVGNIIMLVAANCWALNGILCRKALPFLKPTTITAYGMLFASAALLPFCAFAMFRQDWTSISVTSWWCFAYAVVPASTLSIIFYYFGVKKVGPLHTIVYQNVQPIITAMTVYLMLNEPPNPVQVVGMFTIFLGVYLTRTSKGAADVCPVEP